MTTETCSKGSFVGFPPRWLLQSMNKNEEEEEEERAESGKEKAVPCVFREGFPMHSLSFLNVLLDQGTGDLEAPPVLIYN